MYLPPPQNSQLTSARVPVEEVDWMLVGDCALVNGAWGPGTGKTVDLGSQLTILLPVISGLPYWQQIQFPP